jgi:hypothetical protein
MDRDAAGNYHHSRRLLRVTNSTGYTGPPQRQALSNCARYQSPVRREKTMETMIGKVIHSYTKIGVAAVILEDHLAQGDRIHIYGPHEDVHQSVTSMEIEHVPVEETNLGQDVRLRHPPPLLFPGGAYPSTHMGEGWGYPLPLQRNFSGGWIEPSKK